jgi:hypothetical protein
LSPRWRPEVGGGFRQAIVSEDKIRIVGSIENVRSTFGPQGQPTHQVRKSVQEWSKRRLHGKRMSGHDKGLSAHVRLNKATLVNCDGQYDK